MDGGALVVKGGFEIASIGECVEGLAGSGWEAGMIHEDAVKNSEVLLQRKLRFVGG